MSNIKVSVIVPVYNSSKYLEECIFSIINQSLQEIEIICVDDGSTDESLVVLEKLFTRDKRLKIIKEKNHGTSFARNNGIKNAKGEYLCILDNDDFFERDMLKEAYEKAKKYDADLCIWSFKKYDDIKRTIISKNCGLNTKKINFEPFSIDSVRDIFSITNPASWNKLYKHSFILENDICFKNIIANDVYFTFSSLALSKKIVYINKNLLNYRVGMNDNLEKRILKYPTDFLDALLYIKEKMIKNEIFETTKVSFLNSCIDQITYNLANISINKDVYNYTIERIRTNYIEKIGIFQLKKNEIKNIKNYNRLISALYGDNSNLLLKQSFISRVIGITKNIFEKMI